MENLETISGTNRFTNNYIRLRTLEERVYPDEIVSMLPDIPSTHIHHKEWKIRKRSVQGFINYLRKKTAVHQAPVKILEIGCGNGWLSNKIAQLPGTQVTGVDINEVELSQADKLFGGRNNLRFMADDIFSESFDRECFDIILFAASIQYFSELTKTINRTRSLLKKEGEIHMLDSHFYEGKELAAARERSVNYFSKVGQPTFSDAYFHHSLEEVKLLHGIVLHEPSSMLNKIYYRNPFHWIVFI